MFLTMIYILTLLGSFAGLLYYIVDSFQQKEYKYAQFLNKFTEDRLRYGTIQHHLSKIRDIIEKVETDYGLPQGVKSRRGDKINRSCYWTSHINPKNVDKHIEYAKYSSG